MATRALGAIIVFVFLLQLYNTSSYPDIAVYTAVLNLIFKKFSTWVPTDTAGCVRVLKF